MKKFPTASHPQTESIMGPRIERYLHGLSPSLLGLSRIDRVDILSMNAGSYNHNFVVCINQKRFVFRVNLEQQSGLPNQIEYEFKTLAYLQDHQLAPRVYHLDDSRSFFDFDILIEAFLEGPHLELAEPQIGEAAALLARLHCLALPSHELIQWHDPLPDTFRFVQNDVRQYERCPSANPELLHLARQLLDRIEPAVAAHRHLFHSLSLNHTDLACDNFIRTPDGLRLIDWEKPRLDDNSYDISCFLSEPCQLWCGQNVMTAGQRRAFLAAYACYTDEDPALLSEKLRLREPMVSLHWILWAATKLADLHTRSTVPQLRGAHAQKTARYEAIARPQHIEKLMAAV